jgi:hypothetical protein
MKPEERKLIKEIISKEVKKQLRESKQEKSMNENFIFNALIKLLAYKGLNKAKQTPLWGELSKEASDMKELTRIATDFKPLIDKSIDWLDQPSAKNPKLTNGQVLQKQIQSYNKD